MSMVAEMDHGDRLATAATRPPTLTQVRLGIADHQNVEPERTDNPEKERLPASW